jgi:hypothetical protein
MFEFAKDWFKKPGIVGEEGGGDGELETAEFDLEKLKAQVEVDLMSESYQCKEEMEMQEYDKTVSSLAYKFQEVASEKDFITLLGEIPPNPDNIRRTDKLQMILNKFAPEQAVGN